MPSLQRLGGAVALAAVVALLGCDGSKPDGGNDAGANGAGGSCTVQDDCYGCDECRFRYDEICLSGACWLSGPPDASGEPTYGSYLVIATLPDALDRRLVVSGAVRIYHPERADGTGTTCTQLLADSVAVDEDTGLNLLRALEPRLQIGAADDQTNIGVTAGLGAGRLILVRLHDRSNGEGVLLAEGCIEEVEVALGDACGVDADCPPPERCELGSGATSGNCGPKRLVVELAMP